MLHISRGFMMCEAQQLMIVTASSQGKIKKYGG